MGNYSLEATARTLVAPGKGILAADESLPTIQKRFKALGIESTEENRRAYRTLLISTEEIEDFISGVILFDETIRQGGDDGKSLVNVLMQKGILPGIKVDKGTMDMPGFPNEKITLGLDGLRDRLQEYRSLGARFAKWRAVITISKSTPTRSNIRANAHGLALYAAVSQDAGLVPIVEPEVLMDGEHDIAACEEATEQTLVAVFSALHEYRIDLEGMLLKPNMVVAGKECPTQPSVEEVAVATVRCMRRTVPAAVPGIVFLSGGQTPEQATAHLNAMNGMGRPPWELSFSFARALQEPAMRAWNGVAANVPLAQREFYLRAKSNSEARHGAYLAERRQAA